MATKLSEAMSLSLSLPLSPALPPSLSQLWGTRSGECGQDLRIRDLLRLPCSFAFSSCKLHHDAMRNRAAVPNFQGSTRTDHYTHVVGYQYQEVER